MRKLFLMAVIAGWTAAQLPAQIRITGLDDLASRAKESVNITLDSSMLQLAGGFIGNGKDSEDLKTVLGGLKAITVRSFEFKADGQYKMSDIEPIRAQLRTPGWSKIVSVQEKDEMSEIYARTEQGKVVGFAIIAAEPKELTIIAIEGAIDLKDLSKLRGLGVPQISIPAQSKNPGKKGKEE
jgi:hypothetical protein